MIRKIIIFYSDMELEDSFIENWKYIIKSYNKQTKIKINTNIIRE